MNIKQDSESIKHPKINIWKTIIITVLIIFFTAGVICVGITLKYIKEAPEINTQNFTEKLALTSNIYDMNDKYIEGLHGVENREYVSLTKVNKYTQNAFIAIEDERFNDHFGIDIRRVFGALFNNIRKDNYDQGASTITQQLLKNTVLTPKKELKRKIQEMYLAVKLESKLSKNQILEYYLNTIFLGGSSYGIQAASQYYFSKDAAELDIAESALIAGLTQSPSTYNPYNNEKTPEIYKDRQITVLSKMLELKMITNEEYEKAKNEKLNFKKRDSSPDVKYPWFIDAAISSVRENLKAKYNYKDDDISQMIYSGGLNIYTTIDPKIQDIADKAANDAKYYPVLQKDIAVYGKDNIIQPQIGIVINDYKTGEVRAVVGGRGNQPFRSQNRATDTNYARQPGSAMKPIAVFAPAMDLGYTPSSVIDDSPFSQDESAITSGWPKEGPHNYDDRYRGLTTIRDGVIRSSNVVAAKLMLKITPDTSTDYIKKFGISTLVLSGQPNDTGAAKALGGLTKGVTPLEMSGAYGVLGNGGAYIQPVLYTKVLDRYGSVILEKKQEKHLVISPQAAYMTVDMLKDVINSGTGSAVRTKGQFTSMPSAGKTGTTDKLADAYFAGLTPYYSGVIWMGHDKPSMSLNLTSAETAWMWGDIMRQIHSGLAVKDFDMPEGLISASVCKDSGMLPTDLCAKDPRGSRVISDIFEVGKVPKESCTIHVSVPIDIFTGKIAGSFTLPFFVENKVYIKRPYSVDSRVEDYKYQVPDEFYSMPAVEPKSNYYFPEPDNVPNTYTEPSSKGGKKKR